MLPEKYMDNLKRSARLRAFYNYFFSSIALLSSMFFFGALIHEYSHILVLELIDCVNTVSWSLSSIGITAGVQPLCSMKTLELAIFYSSGYLSVIASGLFIGILSIKLIDKSDLWSSILAGSSIGFLFSIFTSITTDGDIINLMQVLGVPTLVLIPYLAALVASGIITKKVLDGHLERQ